MGRMRNDEITAGEIPRMNAELKHQQQTIFFTEN